MKNAAGKIVALLAISSSAVFADYYMALTDAYTVEIFNETGSLQSAVSLTGSETSSGTALISMAYGDFLSSNPGKELIVLTGSNKVEFYADPLTSGGSLSMLSARTLADGGRSISGITMVQGSTDLAVAAMGTTPYGYTYDGTLAGTTLNRTIYSEMTGAKHVPYVSLAVGSDLNAAAGLDWAMLAADGYVEIFTKGASASPRQTYFNPSAIEIAVTSDNLFALLNSNHTVSFRNFAGSTNVGKAAVTLDTASNLVGFVTMAVPKMASISLIMISGAM
ncbi:MAG: hypothetical protein AB7E95_04085 [Kiritimatiellales bacterium]